MEDDWRIMDVKEEVVDCAFVEIEDHQSTTEHVKEEVLDTEFVEVDSQDVHQLCTACLCATRTTRTLDDDALKQYYMHILAEMQPEGGVVLHSPRVCWECVSHLKRSVRFREQVQESYRLLQPILSVCNKEDQDEFLRTTVGRSGRLKTCFAHSIDIAPQGDNYPGYDRTNLQENDAHTKTEVKDDIKLRNLLNTTFNCDYCYKRFTSKAALERHIATYNIYPHNNKTVPSPCEDCAVVLCSDDQCSECPNKLNLLQDYNMMTIILKVPYQCKVCHKSFSFKSSLLRHKRTHTGEKTYQCKVCQKSFSDKGTLVKHIRTHAGQELFQCEVCHKSFSFKNNLRRHVATHTGQKHFQCKICHKSFSRKDHLLSHLRSHTGEKPNYCEVCGKYFSSKPNLRQHMKTHTGVKLFQCEVCHKSFCAKYNLQEHLRIHTGERPFQCEVCHNWFRNRSGLVKHIRTRICEKSLRKLDILSIGV